MRLAQEENKMNLVQRKIDIEDLIRGLDITPTMYGSYNKYKDFIA